MMPPQRVVSNRIGELSNWKEPPAKGLIDNYVQIQPSSADCPLRQRQYDARDSRG